MRNVTTKHSVPDRIAALREVMKAKAIDACIVPTGDPHMSEYAGDHYKTREFITGFTGSAGTAVITMDRAGLWTDSRYFLQAEEELTESGVDLYRQGLADTISISDYLMQTLQRGFCLSVDGRLVSDNRMGKIRSELSSYEPDIRTELDLVGDIWADRPELEFHSVVDHPLRYAGIPRNEKIRIMRDAMKKTGADALILTQLSDIAWLLNLRGSDIEYNPVFYSFIILTGYKVLIYADQDAFDRELVSALGDDGVEFRPYHCFYDELGEIDSMTSDTISTVMLDRETCSARILHSISDKVDMINEYSPAMRCKAIKNPIEVEGIHSSHLRDGVAMCKFLYWLKKGVGRIGIDEIYAADKLREFRAQQDLFMGDSFETICGYGPHGAIVHYGATAKSNMALACKGLLLVDSGGQYFDGTTDVTRTIVLGPLTQKEKTMFTTVLRGHINLARAKFIKGLSGEHLDYLAHEPLWQMGLDYRHGTGHGVGHYLNVHEDPNRFLWDGAGRTPPIPPFEEGMLTSNEPGYYEDGEFGIRHESLLLCLRDEKTEYGDFLRFEEVTLVPFDLDGIDPSLMQPDEIAYLNDYHEKVYDKIAPLLTEEERLWLREATRPVQ